MKHPRSASGNNRDAIKPGPLINEIDRICVMRYGLICRDEAHEEKKFTLTAAIVALNGTFAIVLVTGSPFYLGPQDILVMATHMMEQILLQMSLLHHTVLIIFGMLRALERIDCEEQQELHTKLMVLLRVFDLDDLVNAQDAKA